MGFLRSVIADAQPRKSDIGIPSTVTKARTLESNTGPFRVEEVAPHQPELLEPLEPSLPGDPPAQPARDSNDIAAFQEAKSASREEPAPVAVLPPVVLTDANSAGSVLDVGEAPVPDAGPSRREAGSAVPQQPLVAPLPDGSDAIRVVAAQPLQEPTAALQNPRFTVGPSRQSHEGPPTPTAEPAARIDVARADETVVHADVPTQAVPDVDGADGKAHVSTEGLPVSPLAGGTREVGLDGSVAVARATQPQQLQTTLHSEFGSHVEDAPARGERTEEHRRSAEPAEPGRDASGEVELQSPPRVSPPDAPSSPVIPLAMTPARQVDPEPGSMRRVERGSSDHRLGQSAPNRVRRATASNAESGVRSAGPGVPADVRRDVPRAASVRSDSPSSARELDAIVDDTVPGAVPAAASSGIATSANGPTRADAPSGATAKRLPETHAPAQIAAPVPVRVPVPETAATPVLVRAPPPAPAQRDGWVPDATVRIGQIDVIIEAPPPRPVKAERAAEPMDLASRHYLRRP